LVSAAPSRGFGVCFDCRNHARNRSCDRIDRRDSNAAAAFEFELPRSRSTH
jgi:hypothetical protein